jgi:hypothetical protein
VPGQGSAASPSSKSSTGTKSEKYTLTLSDGSTREGYIHGGVFYYTDQKPLEWCEVDVQVTVNEQAKGRASRFKKAAKK